MLNDNYILGYFENFAEDTQT